MEKLVVLKFGSGSFEQGFALTLHLGRDNDRPSTEIVGELPPAPEIPQQYHHWQRSYRCLGTPLRLDAPQQQQTNIDGLFECQQAAENLEHCLNQWLCVESFRPIREKLLEQLQPSDQIRVLVQTNDLQLQKLPWHLWELWERYPLTEVALSTPAYTANPVDAWPKSEVHILAILGSSDGIDTEADRVLLEQLPQAQTTLLVEPDRRTLTDQLWATPWDILFFAGHSSSQTEAQQGHICLNATETLGIEDLRYALKKAVTQGLKLAIFNSCDGLGLAHELAELQIPQLIVMREPVPDPVAQAFLQYFLQAFSAGQSLYLAVREARERLQGLEHHFPCATWLPVICQNPAKLPPTWQELCGGRASYPPQPMDAATDPLLTIVVNDDTNPTVASAACPPVALTLPDAPASLGRLPWRRLSWSLLTTSILVTVGMMSLRWLGGLQPLELWAFDQLLRLRPQEQADNRLLVITITEAELQAQGEATRRSSLSDQTLSQLLERLHTYQPDVIGLDIYRDFPVNASQPRLAQQLRDNDRLIAVCKGRDPRSDPTGIAPPPELAQEQLGFTDFIEDSDGVLRRQLLYMRPDPVSPCTTTYAFSAVLAFQYLSHQAQISPQFTAKNQLQLGQTIIERLPPRIGGYQGLDAGGIQLLLNYRSRPSPQEIAPRVTLGQILSGQVNPETIKNKVVLIGVSANSTADYWSTPYGAGGGSKVPGVFIQAQMVSQLLSAVLDQRPLLWAWPQWIDGLWVWGWSVVGGFLAWGLRRTSSLSLGIGSAIIVLTIGCLLGLILGVWLPLIPAGLALLLTGGKFVYTGNIARFTDLVGKTSHGPH